MFLNNEFDVIYHEHSSYFTANSIKKLAVKNGLYVSSIMKTDIHGKSFLFSLQKKWANERELNLLIDEERKNKIFTEEKYIEFSKKAIDTKSKLLEGLQKYRDDGYVIIGYGAAAKGNTLLNYINFKLDCIIDDNEMKWGYLTPGMDIKIVGNGIMNAEPFQFTKICWIPLAWNFYSEIVERIKLVRDTNDDIFIKYFPEYIEEKN
jgi:hypothetical protein